MGQANIKGIIIAALAAAGSAFSIMGYYPLVPALCGIYLLLSKKYYLYYIGLLIGMGYYMSIEEAVKYLFIIAIIHVAYRVYEWINKGISGIAAAVLAGIICAAMNLSAGLIVTQGLNERILGVAEGLMVGGVVIIVHYSVELAAGLFHHNETDESGLLGPRQEAFVNAVEGLSKTIEESAMSQSRKLALETEGVAFCADRASIELNEAWSRRFYENRIVIARQLESMAHLVSEWMGKEKCIDRSKKLKLARIKTLAKEKGIVVESIHLYEGKAGRISIKASLCAKGRGGMATGEYLKVLELAMGECYRLKKDSRLVIGKEPCEIVAYEDVNYYCLPGMASCTKAGSAVSGDSYSAFELENGQYIACLSDGMGSGAPAKAESELVVDLVEKYLEAGFGTKEAIRMLNLSMIMSSDGESFSTLDFASIDLFDGSVSCVKIAAATSFIKRRKEVEYISINSLPAGVEIEQECIIDTRELGNGDFLVMVTDGVLECFHVKSPQEKLGEIIAEISTDNAGVLAKGILDRVLSYTGGYAADDMAVLAIGIWEK